MNRFPRRGLLTFQTEGGLRRAGSVFRGRLSGEPSRRFGVFLESCVLRSQVPHFGTRVASTARALGANIFCIPNSQIRIDTRLDRVNLISGAARKSILIEIDRRAQNLLGKRATCGIFTRWRWILTKGDYVPGSLSGIIEFSRSPSSFPRKKLERATAFDVLPYDQTEP